MNHAIVELEEGSLTAVVGAAEGGKVRILRSMRLPLPELSRDALANALRTLGSQALEGERGVHVVLGERRTQHFVSTLPRMSAQEVEKFLLREAQRLTSMPSPNDVLCSARLQKSLQAGKSAFAATALARNVWEPLAQAFEQAGIEVLGLHSMEACLALAAQRAGGERVAVLECNSGRARFVLCDGDTPAQVRRFLIGASGEHNTSAFAAQLAMELPRTFDWLRETGHQPPTTLVLGTRVGIEDESLEMIRGDLGAIVRADPALRIEDGQLMPGLGVAMLLQRLVAGAAPPSLLEPVRLRLPWGKSLFAMLGAAAAVAAMGSWSAVVDGSSLQESRDRLAVVVAANDRLQTELADLERTMAQEPQMTPDEARLQAALCQRRPTSRLVAELSNCVEGELCLEELKFASTERITIVGWVGGHTRKEALDSFAAFSRRLRALPYLLADGQEEVNEVAGKDNRFRFKVGMAWRNS